MRDTFNSIIVKKFQRILAGTAAPSLSDTGVKIILREQKPIKRNEGIVNPTSRKYVSDGEISKIL